MAGEERGAAQRCNPLLHSPPPGLRGGRGELSRSASPPAFPSLRAGFAAATLRTASLGPRGNSASLWLLTGASVRPGLARYSSSGGGLAQDGVEAETLPAFRRSACLAAPNGLRGGGLPLLLRTGLTRGGRGAAANRGPSEPKAEPFSKEERRAHGDSSANQAGGGWRALILSFSPVATFTFAVFNSPVSRRCSAEGSSGELLLQAASRWRQSTPLLAARGRGRGGCRFTGAQMMPAPTPGLDAALPTRRKGAGLNQGSVM